MEMEDQQQPSRPRGRGPIVGLSPPSGSTKRRAHDAEDEHTPPAVGTKRARSSSGGKEREEGGATPTAGNGLPASPAPRAPSPSSSSSSSSSVPPKGASPGQRAASPQGTPLRAAAAGLPVLVAAMRSCRSVDHYERLNRIQEGAYGVVRTHTPPPATPPPLWRRQSCRPLLSSHPSPSPFPLHSPLRFPPAPLFVVIAVRAQTGRRTRRRGRWWR